MDVPIGRRAALVGAATASLGLPKPGRAAAPDTLTVAVQAEVPNLDPTRDATLFGWNYRFNVFDQLTQLHPDGSVGPMIATEWSASPDQVVWTFRIRPGVKFHDGGDLTVDDVAFTANRILGDATSPVRIWLKLVDKAETVDADTFRFTLTQPSSTFARQMSLLSIASRKAYDRIGSQGYATRPIGSGPYRLVDWARDDHMTMEASPGYWGGVPAVKKVVLRPIPSDASRVAALLSGAVDLVPVVPPSLMPQIQASRVARVGTAPGFRVVFAGFNTTVAPFDDPKVREAIDRCIDRDAIVKQLLRGLGKPTGIMVPPVDVGYSPIPPTPFDPQAAKALMAASSYRGETFAFQYPTNAIASGSEVAQAMAGFLANIGLKSQLQPMENGTFLDTWLQGKMSGMYLFAFGASGYHGDPILAYMYESGGVGNEYDPEIERLAKLQRTIGDPEQQRAAFAEIFRISNQKRFYLPLFDEWQAFGVRNGIDYTPYPDGFLRAAQVK